MTYLSADPGKSGAIAAITPNGAFAHKMPATDKDLLDLLRDLTSEGPCFAMVELVNSSPQMGVVSAFTFGLGYGKLLMALCAAKIPYDQVTPRKWQTAMQCLTGGNKNVSKARASQLFPSIQITHAIADALLIAEYCKRVKTGEISR